MGVNDSCYPYADVQLELRVRDNSTVAQIIPNHDLIDISLIGDVAVDGDTFLACSTTADYGLGEWHFPNDTLVTGPGDNTTGPDIYSTEEAMAVFLSRRRNATSPVGIYVCDIYNNSNDTQSLYVGIYTTDGGTQKYLY